MLFDRPPSHYAGILFLYRVARPQLFAVQFVLLTVAWTHGCIGLYFWLRLKPLFKWAAPFLLAVAVLLPPLAMLGANQGAREVMRLAAQPQWRAEHLEAAPTGSAVLLIEEIVISSSRSATSASSVWFLSPVGRVRCASGAVA